MTQYIVGAGGGKSGGDAGRVAVEAPNTLKSKSYVKIVEVLSEGEIEGLVNGARSIYFDSTPLQNEDGTYNFKDVVFEQKTGTLNQNAGAITQGTASVTNIGVKITKANPVEHTITAPEVDRARVAIRIPSLTQQNTSNGDLNGTSVSLKFEYKDATSGWISPLVGTSVVSLNPNNFTGAQVVNGEVRVTLESYSTTISGRNADRRVTAYYPSVVTLQYNSGSGWVTFKETTVTRGSGGPISSLTPKGAVTSPFSLVTNPSSTYQLRVLVDRGSAEFSFLNGTIASSEVTISGKTTSPYERDVEFALTGTAPWTIRVTRLTDDSTSAALQNETYLSTVTAVFDEKFRYPGTAYVGISIDAEQFSSIPTRAYDVKLLKVKVPTNYDPISREYTGIWDGTFKVEWTDNPAWCFYDLLTNKRYGLGDRLDVSQIDKWTLYAIAQYCDEMVDDGEGGVSPRFTCNVLIQSREEAYKVLQDMSSIFAGIVYWGATADGFSGIIPVQDRPHESIACVYTNANVENGVFSYSTANVNTQFNAVYVTYNDPLQEYKQAVVYVPDDQRIASDGYLRETNVTAYGCTSKAQAIRFARRILYANTYENEVLNFTVGADGAIPNFGSIIKVSDSLKAGERRGGRIVEQLSSTQLKLDAAFDFQSGVVYNISLMGYDGNHYESQLVNPGVATDTVTLVTPLSGDIAKNSVFIISNNTLEYALYRVASISEVDTNKYAISATKYNPSKYDYVDDLVPLDIPDTSNLELRGPITNLSYSEVLYQDNSNVKSKLVLSWTPARLSSSYVVSYSYAGNNVITNTVTSPSFEILDTSLATYEVSVVSVDILGGKSAPVTMNIEVKGKLAAPANVTGLTVNAFSNTANISWDLHPDLDVRVGGFIEIRHTSKTTGYQWEDGIPIATTPGSQVSVITSLLAGTYMAKAVDSSGVYSEVAAFADSSFALFQQLNVVATVQEQTAWAGAKTNVTKSGDVITLLSTGTIDEVIILWDDIPSVDALGFEISPTGTYEFANMIDLGAIVTVRATADLEYFAYDIADSLDARSTLIDTWVAFDGNVANTSFVKLYVSTTDDDPSGISPVWGAWREFVVADYKARGFKFKIEFTNSIPTNSIDVLRAQVQLDMADRVVGQDDISAPDTGYSVVYNYPFYVKPSVAIRIDNMQQGDYYEITSNTASGFTILFKDSSGTPVARQFDYISKGYGYVFT